MKRISSTATGRAVRVIVPAVALLAAVVILGALLAWPSLAIGVACAVSIVLLAFVLRALRSGFDVRQRWLQHGQAAVIIGLAICSAVVAVMTYQRWIERPQQHARDVQQVAAEASIVAGLLTTIVNADHDRYLQELRPHVTDEVLQALKGNAVGVPSGAFTQTSAVTSVAVEVVNDGAATAIAVVRPTPPPPPTGVDSDPNDIILFLVLARFDDRWVLANLAPLGVRPEYAS